MEQHHLCYLKDKDKYFKTLESVDSLKEIPDKLNELNKNYIRAFENVPNKDINKYSTIIDKLIKNNENYSVFPDVKYKEYKKQILEEEAFYAGKTGPKFRWLDKDSLLYPKGLIVYGLYVLIGASALSFAKDGYDTYKKTKI